MSLTVSIDTRPFDAYIADLARRLGTSLEVAQRMEAAAVVKRAAVIQSRRVGSIASVRREAAKQAVKRIDNGTDIITVNLKRDPGRAWYSDRAPGRDIHSVPMRWFPIGKINSFRTMPRMAFNTGWRFPNVVWNAARNLWQREQNDIRKSIEGALASRGLTVRSWLEIIDALGVSIERIPPRSPRLPFRNATVRTGQNPPRNGTGFSSVQKGNPITEIANSSPLAFLNGGTRALSAAIAIRAAAYRAAMRNRAFQTAQGRARLYGFIVS